MPSLALICRHVALIAFIVVTLVAGREAVGRADDRVPCDTRPVLAAPDGGWRVQVDPETGIYSMPAPAALSASAAGTRDRELVITPGTSPAGGYKIQLEGTAAAPVEQQ